METEKSDPGDAPEHSAKTLAYYPTVRCYVCLETGYAQVESSYISRTPRVTYTSPYSPQLGPLILPCECKTSFVHETCFAKMRSDYMAQGNQSAKRCTLCRTDFRFERLFWAKIIDNWLAHILLAILLAFLIVYLFGFIADPIINLYLDPVETIRNSDYFAPNVDPLAAYLGKKNSFWVQHFAKGLSSLGVLSCINVFLTMSPIHWWNFRTSNIFRGSGRPTTTGRERVANISLTVIAIGIISFLYYLWKSIKVFTERELRRFSLIVLNTQDFMKFPEYQSVQYDKAAQEHYNALQLAQDTQ